MSDPRTDLTRWNRTGLTRFDYVDGNAAVFLEHLRAKMIAGFLRGIPAAEFGRDPEFWFDLLRDADHPLPASGTYKGYLDALQWSDLADGLPAAQETKAERNTRLVTNYHSETDDYAAAILHAFARTGHVLSGYIDAYLNESYLATATQWDALHKLGQMVNYAPVPAASASTTVALALTDDAGKVTINKGLAMSAPPATGGAPLIFETLADVTGHPDLNAVRQRRWDVNRTVLTLSTLNTWLRDGADPPKPGDLALITPGKMTEPSAKAVRIAETRPGKTDDEIQLRTEDQPLGKWRAHYTELWYAPDGVLTGQPISSTTYTVVAGAGLQASTGSLVEVELSTGSKVIAVVAATEDESLSLTSDDDLDKVTGVRPLAEYDVSESYFETGTNPSMVYFNVGGSVQSEATDLSETLSESCTEAKTGIRKSGGKTVAYRYKVRSGAISGGVKDTGAEFTAVKRVADPPKITDTLANPSATVGFAGKPPKKLTEGSFFVALSDDTLVPLRVRGVRTEAEEYFILFNKKTDGVPETTQFFGPMTQMVQVKDHDRNVDPILDAQGYVLLAGLSDTAKTLIREGDRVIIENERETGASPLLATVDEVSTGSKYTGFDEGEQDQAKVRFSGLASDYSGFVTGWTVFRFNTVLAGHGETKPGKTLGTGNGEKRRQTLPLDVKSISFIADATAGTGVRPDIGLTVDGVLWDYTDLTDFNAEDTNSYSIRPRDDGTLDIVFRRRLPTGRNNIRVSRHRIGSGADGNLIAARSFTKPKSKHRHVSAIVQPFAAAGGADRESTDSIRENAGAVIAANDRAVSLQDFSRLVRRHASVWDARAEQLLRGGRSETVRITVVPAGGTELTEDLKDSLQTHLKARVLPGTTTEIEEFGRLHVTLSAALRADTEQFQKDELRDTAIAALFAAFGLKERRLGQTFFVAEVLAALEALDGVETVQATLAVKSDTTVTDDQIFESSTGVIRAIYPTGQQTAFVEASTDITITVQGLL